jgi:mRNA-degrading endonuclease RelE of RelBE toxin-antitoxin system
MPDSFDVAYSPAAARDLDRLPAQDAERIMRAVGSKLAQAPFQYAKKLAGVPAGQGQWRFRVGDYRIRFDFAAPSRLLVFRIRHRRDVYRL